MKNKSETELLIVDKALKLFLEKGIRNVTVENLSAKLKVSTRTLYEIFGDKDGLIKECISMYYSKTNSEHELILKNSKNTFEALFRLKEIIVERNNQISPYFFDDLINYYAKFEKGVFVDNGDFGIRQIVFLINQGIKEGLFLPTIDVDIFSKTLIQLIRIEKNSELFPILKYSGRDLFRNIHYPYFRGICTQKGLKSLELYSSYR